MTFIIKVSVGKLYGSGSKLCEKITKILTDNQNPQQTNNYACAFNNAHMYGAEILIEIQSDSTKSGVTHLRSVAKEIAESVIMDYSSGSTAIVTIDLDGCKACVQAAKQK